MRTSSAKAKGRRACAEAKAMLLLHAMDHLEDEDVIITSSGATGEDLMLSPKARKRYPYCFELKNQERLNVWDAITQAQQHCHGRTDRPVVVFKRNNTHLRCIIDFSLFCELVNKCATTPTL